MHNRQTSVQASGHCFQTVRLEQGYLLLARDWVSLQQEKVTVWSTECAKFCQWQARYSLSEAVAAVLGTAQHYHSLASLTQGARMPAWQYLMAIMSQHSLNVIVGLSATD